MWKEMGLWSRDGIAWIDMQAKLSNNPVKWNIHNPAPLHPIAMTNLVMIQFYYAKNILYYFSHVKTSYNVKGRIDLQAS